MDSSTGDKKIVVVRLFVVMMNELGLGVGALLKRRGRGLHPLLPWVRRLHRA
jgi:hypothetical protein